MGFCRPFKMASIGLGSKEGQPKVQRDKSSKKSRGQKVRRSKNSRGQIFSDY